MSAAAGVSRSDSSVSRQSSSMRRANEKGACGKACDACGDCVGNFFANTTLGLMIAEEFGAWINFLLGAVLFFALGLPVLAKYGYDSDERNDDGGVPSGELGSGVGVVTLTLFILATIVFLIKMVYAYGRAKVTLAEAAEAH